MNTHMTRFIGLAFVTLSLAAPSAAPDNPAAFPRDGATQLKEKEGAVAWEVTWKKGVSTGMRTLAWDQVSFTLSDGAVKVTRPDGSFTMQQLRTGTARFAPQGTVQAEEGVSDTAAREFVLQLKTPYTPGKYAKTPGISGKFPRAGTLKVFETDRFIVWDQQWPVGLHDGLHLHYMESLGVFIHGGKIRNYDVSGMASPTLGERKPGDIVFESGPIKAPHDEECAEGPMQIMWVEYK